MQAFLAVPARVPVMVAKLVACMLLGVSLAIACVLFSLAVALPWTAAQDQPVAIGSGEMWTVFAGVVLSTGLYGALGVGIGALLRNQVTALLVALGWFVVVESALVATLPEVAKWLPGGAATSLSHGPEQQDLLPMGWAGLVLLAYVAAFAAAGVYAVKRRDVD